MLKFGLIAGVLILMLQTTTARAESFGCVYASGEIVMPRSFVIAVDGQAGTARFDPPLYDDDRRELVGKVTRNDASRIEVTFGDVRLSGSGGQQTVLRNNITYIRGRGIGTILSVPTGYKNRFIAQLRCAPA